MTHYNNPPKVKLPQLVPFFFTFFVAGLLALILFAIPIVEDLVFYQDAIKVTATVENSELKQGGNENMTFLSRVRYEVGGKSYSKIVEGNVEQHPNAKVWLYCNPENPNETRVSDFDWVLAFFILLPLVFVTIGLVGLIKQLSIHQKSVSAVKGGYKIAAGNIKVEIVHNFVVKTGRNRSRSQFPYILVCEYADTESGGYYQFQSHHFFTDPRDAIDALGIETLDVYVDPNNYHNYYVDISFLNMR